MKVFLSYAGEDRALATQVASALRAERHVVHFDATDLKQGDAYNQRIRQAIDDSDAMVWLLSPEAVEPGCYAMTEYELARRKWPDDPGRIFPFFARPTDRLPPDLPATTIEHTQGHLPAKVVEVIARAHRLDIRTRKIEAATRLVQALRTLDNGIRDHLATFSAFDPGWPDDLRRARIDALVTFAHRSQLIVDVRNAYSTLNALIDWSPGPPDELAPVLGLAGQYLLQLGGDHSPTPFKSAEAMDAFFDSIRSAATPEAATAVRRWALNTMQVVDGGRLAEAEGRCAALRAQLTVG
jgi:hypothetical protein